MSKYAYLDKSGVLHVTTVESTATEQEKYVLTDIEDNGTGYPVVNGETVVYYSRQDSAYINGNIKDGELIPTPQAIKRLADQLK